MRFHRVNIEITNICGLACSFCPPKTQSSKTIPLAFFEEILDQLKPHTHLLALHLMGDPLTLSNLSYYLDRAYDRGFAVELTTSGYYLPKTSFETLFHPAVRQINISLNSFQKNSLTISLESYMEGVFRVCREKISYYPKPFINLRLWNAQGDASDAEFNWKIASMIEQEFHLSEPLSFVKGERLAPKVLLHIDTYFEWPTLEASEHTDGYCHGMTSHIGILADGRVVPCCLDADAVMELGSLREHSLTEILQSPRAQAIKEGFTQGKAVELLCQKCTYKTRFA